MAHHPMTLFPFLKPFCILYEHFLKHFIPQHPFSMNLAEFGTWIPLWSSPGPRPGIAGAPQPLLSTQLSFGPFLAGVAL